MKFSHLIAALALTASMSAVAQDENQPVFVKMTTNRGEIVLQLYPEKAPKSVDNFLRYVNEEYYNGTIFHRVISTFMIQGGGFTADFQKKSTNEPIANEADNMLPNKRGSIAMARTGHPDSATAQFFINVADNMALNHTGKISSRAWGYAVFGQVISGMGVVDTIRTTETGPGGPFPGDAPLETVIIESVTVLDALPEAGEQPAAEEATNPEGP